MTSEVDLFNGLTYSPNNIEKDGTLVLRSSNVKNGEIVNADNVYVNPKVVNCDNVQLGDIIVVVRNGSRALIGKHAEIKHKMDNTVIGAFMTGLRSENHSFINSLLDTNHFSNEVEKNLGATINQITNGMFEKMEFIFPNNSEQTQIGTFFKTLDNLITCHQRKYVCLFIVIISKTTTKTSVFTETWEQRELGEVIDINSGCDYKHLNIGDIPVFGTGGYMLSVDKALSYKSDAIGIGRKGTIDKPYLLKAPFWTVDTLFFAIPKANIELNFMFDVFQKINWKQKDESTGVPSLSKVAINNVEIHITDLQEQTKIGTFFKTLDNLITCHQRKPIKIRRNNNVNRNQRNRLVLRLL